MPVKLCYTSFSIRPRVLKHSGRGGERAREPFRPTIALAILSLWLATGTTTVRAAPGDENWDNRFGAPGIGGIFSPSVSAIAVRGTDVYVGGQFTQINGISALNVAKWNGSGWSALGSGLGTSTTGVLALAVMGTSVYAGGSFTTSGATSVSRIARWDGAAWSQVGGGVDETVFALATDGTNLYAGGSFGTAGGPGANANAVARWNGTQWQPLSGPLGNGAGGAVFSIAVLGSDVFIGGNFFSVGLTLGVNNGISAKGIARWTGAQWFALGTGLGGLDYRTQAMAVMGSDLYVGGHFTSAGGVATKGIAKWTGSGWVSLGGISGHYEEVLGLTVSNGNIFAAGTFSAAGGVPAMNIAQWNGSTWSALGSGIGDSIYYGNATAATPNELYAGGNFFEAGGKSSRFFASYSFAPIVTAPEIAVEQPAGTNIADGGSQSFGSVATGANAGRTFTIRNQGTVSLTGLSITRDGASAADFTVTAPGTATVTAGGSTTFTVTFAPAATGARSAALHIASNDADENPFDIILTGTGTQAAPGSEFSSTGAITIASSGNASPYPSIITVSGITGTVTAVKVKLNGVTHDYWDDVDAFLVAPGGGVCSLLSDAGGGNSNANVNLVFDDAAAMPPPDETVIAAGTWHPVNYEQDEQDEPLPPGGTGSIGTSLFALAAGSVNGDWKLFVSDDESGDAGSIPSWSLVLETATAPAALESWRQTHFGSTANTGNGANLADPDADGILNILEYGLGLNPNQNSAGQMPQGQLAGTDLVVGFTQPPGVSGVTLGAEWSPTLMPGSWTSIADTGTPPQHTFRTPMGTNKKLFVRLKITVQ